MAKNTSKKPLLKPALAGLTQSDSAFVDTVVELVKTRHGYDFSGYKKNMLMRGIAHRMALVKAGSPADYIALLQKSAQEIDALKNYFMITVSAFFRVPEAWNELEKSVLEPLVKNRTAGTPVRVWVIGAATGEEAYSLAMLLLETCKRLGKSCPIQVFSTDRNEESLAFARAGIYPPGIMAQVPSVLLKKYFRVINSGQHYQVTRELRDAVVFGTHDVLADPPCADVDLISCRNLLIFLKPEAQHKLISSFHSALRPGGFLFLGGEETVGSGEGWFAAVSESHHVYRKLDGISRNMQLGAGVMMPQPRKRMEQAVTQVQQLARELKATQEDLQGTIEHLQALHQSLNNNYDEVCSDNKRLQFVSEELECSREELHSIRDGMSSEGRKLRARVAELELSNNELKNMLESTEIAAIRLDTEGRIRWFTPAMGKVIQLKQADIGREVSDFAPMLSGNDLLQDAKKVMESLAPTQTEMKAKGDNWLLRRILPSHGEKGEIDGVVIIFTDISASKNMMEATRASHKSFTEELEKRVTERTSQLQALSFELAMAEERERRALAQDLHDNLGQLLAVAKIKLTSLLKKCNCGDKLPLLNDVHDMVARANKSVHLLAFQLSPPLQGEAGLLPVFQWIAEEVRTVYGLNVYILDDGLPKVVEPRANVIIFRAVRELLINVAKHANVTQADLSLLRKGEHVVITVHDDGKGIDFDAIVSRPHDGGFGLVSMRERLNFIGGMVEIESYPGEGTTVRLRVPLPQSENQEPAR